MMINKRVVALLMALAVVLKCSMFGVIQVFAHDAILDVEYDNCSAEDQADGIDEMWYALDRYSECYHISHDEFTIKYYFADADEGSTYTWNTDVSTIVAQEIKYRYAKSMKKWNDVYFYSYNSDGTLVKNKVINIVEGTELDHNLTIYPVEGKNYIAETRRVGDSSVIENSTIIHSHYSEWEMRINNWLFLCA